MAIDEVADHLIQAISPVRLERGASRACDMFPRAAHLQRWQRLGDLEALDASLDITRERLRATSFQWPMAAMYPARLMSPAQME